MNKIEAIFSQIDNRSYPLPDKPWKYYQEWHDVVMLHYPANHACLLKLLPEGLQLDTFNERAWISLLMFSVKKLRPRFLPALPYLSCFNEINLRTYVIRDRVPGIYMLAIEANKFLDVIIPRWFLGVPYVKASMHKRSGFFGSENKTKHKSLEVKFRAGTLIVNKTAIDKWLTERHALYVEKKRVLYRFDIHHKEWELQDVAVTSINQNYTTGISTAPPGRQHFSKNTNVVIWGRKAVYRY